MFIHSRGEIKSVVVSAVYEPDGTATKILLLHAVPPIVSHPLFPVCAFVEHRSCNALSSIRLLWEDLSLLLSVQGLFITRLHE